MAFLDNSGDIILDAVLTDTGRLRLAQGDGSFKISKFALGDDEINYALYDKAHASGSAYYDLEVLQTPVLEAFTNNTSTMKTKLISIGRTNILYLPTLKLNRNNSKSGDGFTLQQGPSHYFSYTISGDDATEGATVAENAKFYVAVDEDTWNAVTLRRNSGESTPHRTNAATTLGLIQGYSGTGESHLIRVDQGLDTTEVPPALSLDSDLLESTFIVELDYRMGRVKSSLENAITPVNFIDDDNIASYTVNDSMYVNPKGSPGDQFVAGTNSYTKADLDADHNPMVFEGPRGNTFQFRIQASQELQSSTYLFNQLGNSESATASGNILGLPTSNDNFVSGKTIYYIDSTVRVVGANTGYRLDIPIRYVKLA